MPNTFAQYDPSAVALVIAGIPVTGFHSGTFIKCERDAETWKKDKGSQGDTVRVRNRNKGGKITFTLQATSPSNRLLLARANLDERTGRGYGASMCKDNFGTALVDAANSWIIKPANIEFADEHTPREWEVDCDELEFREQIVL